MFVNQDDKSKKLLGMLKLRDGQMRDSRSTGFHRNLFWTLNPKTTFPNLITVAIGFGDLDLEDIERISDWMRHPSNDGLIFRGWNEHHGSLMQQFAEPVIEINSKGQLTSPVTEARKKRMRQEVGRIKGQHKKENNEVR